MKKGNNQSHTKLKGSMQSWVLGQQNPITLNLPHRKRGCSSVAVRRGEKGSNFKLLMR